MGADMLIAIAAIPFDREPDWAAAERFIDEQPLDVLDPDQIYREEEVGELRTSLHERLARVRAYVDGEGYGREWAEIWVRGLRIVLTGGLSSGEAPTDAFEDLSALWPVLKAAGFNDDSWDEIPSHEIPMADVIA